MVEDAIGRFKLGLEVSYDIGFGWGPGGPPSPGAPPQLMLAYWIVVSIKSPLLGQGPISHVSVMQNFMPTQKDIDEVIMQGCISLRDSKAKVMTLGNGQEIKRG
jgi:hypothetical protein